METRLESLIGPIVREAGKTFGNAVGEVREAVDFLRYYARCVEGFSNDTHRPLGLLACISPGTSRCRSSPARSPERWRPAMR